MDEFNKGPNRNNKKQGKVVQKFSKIFDKDGFYIILFLCICIVATTAAWVSQNNVEKLKDLSKDYMENDFVENNFDWDETQIDDEENIITKEENIKETKEEVNATKSTNINGTSVKEENKQIKEINADEKTKEEKIEEQKKNVVSVSSVSSQQKQSQILGSLIVPMKGKIGMDYAEDKLVYSKTLEQWTTHLGIDILSREGSVVKAVQDGIIAEVKNDETMGITITIDHGNGILTRYSNLSTDEMVKVGQEVKKGDSISGIGKGAGFEMAEGPHLHFELIVDGENVDPKEYLPKLTN